MTLGAFSVVWEVSNFLPLDLLTSARLRVVASTVSDDAAATAADDLGVALRTEPLLTDGDELILESRPVLVLGDRESSSVIEGPRSFKVGVGLLRPTRKLPRVLFSVFSSAVDALLAIGSVLSTLLLAVDLDLPLDLTGELVEETSVAVD